jgi:hypothetical protein
MDSSETHTLACRQPFDKLVKALPMLRVLRIRGSVVDDSALCALATLPHLQLLGMSVFVCVLWLVPQ